jgi:hypothetical protein
MTITTLPVAPSRADPANFATRADALLVALPTFVTEANALQADVVAKQLLVDADAAAATASEVAASASAIAAALSEDAAAASEAAVFAQALAAEASAAASAASATEADADRIAAQAAQVGAEAAWTAALAANPDLDPVVRMNPSTITSDLTIPSHYNAYSAGPELTIGEGVEVTLDDNSNWSVL